MAETNVAPNQFLSFRLDEESFAVPVSKVREVLEYTRITKVPDTADYLLGIINIRGTGVPVIDLRSRFGLPRKASPEDSSIIVMETNRGGDDVVAGVLVDGVREVTEIPAARISAAPSLGMGKLDSSFVRGIGEQGGEFIIVLEVNRILMDEMASGVQRSAADMPNEVEEA